MKITIDEIEYNWNDSFATITIEEYLKMLSSVGLPPIERLSAFTTIPVETINRMTMQQISMLFESVSFIENENILSAISEPYEGTQVNAESYRKLCRAKKLSKDGMVLNGAKIAEVYCSRYIQGKPVTEVWNIVSFYIQSLSNFFKRFDRLNLHEYTDEEKEASVDQLSIYGDFSVVVKIGRERGLLNDEVFEISAEEIYMEMLLDFDRSEYEKRYSQIVERNRNHFANQRQ